ncbi:hypothetical protein LguiA_015610 [Lonicera macranthoides]
MCYTKPRKDLDHQASEDMHKNDLHMFYKLSKPRKDQEHKKSKDTHKKIKHHENLNYH